MYYRMTVAGLQRDLPICPVNDKLYIAGFVIFGDQELTVACAGELLKKAPEYDYIVVNDTIDNAVEGVETIIKCERKKSFRNKTFISEVINNV